MSNSAAATELKQPSTLVFNLVGRIDQQRQHNNFIYTQVTTPAPDAYSMPSQFEIRSVQPLGPIGQEFKGRVRISGFIRQRQYNDKNTGELKQVADKNVMLELA